MRHPASSLFASLAITAFLAGAWAWADEPPSAPAAQPDAQAPQAQPDAPQAKQDEPPPKTPAEERADLYARLADSKDADETAGIITRLLHSYSESGSDTADLLLQRARHAIGVEKDSDALKVYERVLEIAPHWRNAEEAADKIKAALAGSEL